GNCGGARTWRFVGERGIQVRQRAAKLCECANRAAQEAHGRPGNAESQQYSQGPLGIRFADRGDGLAERRENRIQTRFERRGRRGEGPDLDPLADRAGAAEPQGGRRDRSDDARGKKGIRGSSAGYHPRRRVTARRLWPSKAARAKTL